MSSIIEISDLAVDRRGKSFAPHAEARYWQPKRITASQTVVCTRFGKRVYVPINATLDEFEESIGYMPGMYMLEQARDDQTVIEDAPRAYIEVQGMDLRTSGQRVGAEELLGLAGQAIHANEQKDALLADVVKSMLNTQVQLQMGTVKVINAVGTMLPVASGIQAIERPPPMVDVDEMATMLLEAMEDQREERDPNNDNDDRDHDQPSWIREMFRHPAVKLFGEQFMGLVLQRLFDFQRAQTDAKDAKNDNKNKK